MERTDSVTMTNEELADLLIQRLNEICAADPRALLQLIESRVSCNDVLAEHPTVQVASSSNGTHEVGMLGVLNGIVGTIKGGPKDGWGYIAASIDEQGSLVGFVRTDSAGVVPLPAAEKGLVCISGLVVGAFDQVFVVRERRLHRSLMCATLDMSRWGPHAAKLLRWCEERAEVQLVVVERAQQWTIEQSAYIDAVHADGDTPSFLRLVAASERGKFSSVTLRSERTT